MSVILIAEDDRSIREGLSDALELAGYEVEAASDGAEALRLFAARKFDLLLLDVMMPKCDGFEVCRRIRISNPATPIVFLTAKGEEIDKVVGLELGADDYVTKPFSVRELCARIAARLRRTAAATQSDEQENSPFDFASWRVDPARLRAENGAAKIDLSEREIALLRFFAAHPGTALRRERIMAEVWHAPDISSRTLDQHMVALRRKLESADGNSRIESIYGIGYRFEA